MDFLTLFFFNVSCLEVWQTKTSGGINTYISYIVVFVAFRADKKNILCCSTSFAVYVEVCLENIHDQIEHKLTPGPLEMCKTFQQR